MINNLKDWPNEKLKLVFGFLLLIVLALLAATVAIGHVHQEASYGLDYILGSLSTLSGGFVTWAFTHKKEDK